jgi:hypothetical protein|tara:strand:- start:5559 stop:5819 length:261 start_codon:yes stop_codon:yes gene_type:complete
MNEIKYENKTIKIPKPFNECNFGKNPLEKVEIANRFSGEKTMLPNFAVAIYDVIIGSEVINDHQTMRKGLDWFSKNFTNEYMVLLD